MEPGGVVVDSPPLDQDLRLFEGAEDLPVEQFISELAVEALVAAVLPGTAGLDGEGFHPKSGQPLAHGFGRELAAGVRAYVLRRPMAQKELRQTAQHILAVEPPGDLDGQGDPGGLVDDRQQPIGSAVVGTMMHKV